MQHLLTLLDMTTAEIERVLTLARDLKNRYEAGVREPLFPGRVLGLLFEKPSLRTRISFEAGIAHLGGNSIYLTSDVGWGQRETPTDFIRVLSQYLDVLVCRGHDQQLLELLARESACPIINGLTNTYHPCQALADLFTMRELRGNLEGATLAFIGDGNNVARSLAVACGHLGVRMIVASPAGYELDPPFLQALKQAVPKVQLEQTQDPVEAIRDATVVYTDVWASMGQEKEAAQRRRDFSRFQVNGQLMTHAPRDAYFFHCLPAHRGEEVTDEVLDGPQSAVIRQAANRLHAQKGVLAWLLSSRVQ